MNKVAWLAALTLIVMFLVGINNLVMTLPGWHILSGVLPEYLRDWTMDPQSLYSLILNLCLVVFPILTGGLFYQERRSRAGDYSAREDQGVITVSETAIRKILLSTCRRAPCVADCAVDLANAGSGIDVSIRVKVDRPENWPMVKGEILKQTRHVLNETLGKDVIHNLSLTFADFVSDPQSLARPAVAPALPAASAKLPEPPPAPKTPEPAKVDAQADRDEKREKAKTDGEKEDGKKDKKNINEEENPFMGL